VKTTTASCLTTRASRPRSDVVPHPNHVCPVIDSSTFVAVRPNGMEEVWPSTPRRTADPVPTGERPARRRADGGRRIGSHRIYRKASSAATRRSRRGPTGHWNCRIGAIAGSSSPRRRVVGWTALGRYSTREVYAASRGERVRREAAVVAASHGARRDARGGVGGGRRLELLRASSSRTRRAGLHEHAGFRRIGVQERLGAMRRAAGVMSSCSSGAASRPAPDQDANEPRVPP